MSAVWTTTTGSPVPATSTTSSSSPTDTIVRRTIDHSLAYAKRNLVEPDRPISAQQQSRRRRVTGPETPEVRRRDEHQPADGSGTIRHCVIAEGDSVAVHSTLTGRHTGHLMGVPPTGRRVATPMVHILRFRDGLAAEHGAVHDDLATMRQLGLVPSPA